MQGGWLIEGSARTRRPTFKSSSCWAAERALAFSLLLFTHIVVASANACKRNDARNDAVGEGCLLQPAPCLLGVEEIKHVLLNTHTRGARAMQQKTVSAASS